MLHPTPTLWERRFAVLPHPPPSLGLSCASMLKPWCCQRFSKSGVRGIVALLQKMPRVQKIIYEADTSGLHPACVLPGGLHFQALKFFEVDSLSSLDRYKTLKSIYYHYCTSYTSF